MGPNYNYNKQQQEAKSRKQEPGVNQLQPRGGCAPFSTSCSFVLGYSYASMKSSGINAAYLSTGHVRASDYQKYIKSCLFHN